MTSETQAQCILFKGVAALLSGDEKGIKFIKKVSETYPDMIKETARYWEKDGIKALGDKDFTKAKNLFQRSLILIRSETSQDKELKYCLLRNLATAYFHLKEYQTALEKGEEAYALNPSFSLEEIEKWKERAEGFLIQNSFALSIDYCTFAIKLTPDEAKYANLRCTLLSCRSVAYAKTNQHKKALKDAEKCIILTSTADTSKKMYAKFTAIRGNIVMESHPSLAELFFNCSFFHAEDPFDEARCLLYKAVASWLSGNQSKALMDIEEASKIYPGIIEETARYWEKGGVKALGDKDLTKAKNLFQRSLILIQSETSQYKEIKSCLLSNLATVYFHLDEYQSALEKGEEAYALNPFSSHEEAEKWKKRIEKIPRQENFELLIRYYTLAIKFVPEEEYSEDLRFALLSSRCNTYIKMNKYEQAIEDIMKCLTMKPNWLKGHQQLGDFFDNLGRHREAVHSYCKAFAIAGFPEKKSILLQILLVSEKIPDGTADVTLDVPKEMVNEIIKQCLCDQDWGKLHLLFIGGGGPQKYNYGKGGLAAGCDAYSVPLELVVEWGLDNSVNYLPEFLDELLKHGATISGSPGCSISPLEIAEKRQDKGVLRVFRKYRKSQGTMWRKKGTEAYDSGDLGKAVFAFRRSIQCEMEFQDRIEVHLALSKTYFEIKDYQNSVSTCNRAEEFADAKKEVPSPIIKSLLFELVCLRGFAHYHLRKLQQALQDGIKATQLNADDIKGYTLLVSCYKDLRQHSAEMLSALNECLKREGNPEKQWKLFKEAIEVALNLPTETTNLTAKIPTKLLKRRFEEAVSTKDWNLIRLLYLGGGGPEEYPKGKGGIAIGRVSAKNIALEDVISAKFKAKQETLSVLLEEGASVDGLNSNPLISVVEKGQVEVAKTLLKFNANPCVTGRRDNQPLVHEVVKNAIETGNLTMLKCFLDSRHPSILNVKDSNGNSLYHLAMDKKNNSNKCKVIRCLLNADVNPEIKNKKGKLPTDCCKKSDDRRKMIEKFIKERNENCFRPPADDVPQPSPQKSTKRDPSSVSKSAVPTRKQVSRPRIKKKDVRKELEELIENITITEREIDIHFDEEIEQEESKLLEVSKRPDEVWAARESAREEKADAFIQKIDETVFKGLPWEVDFSDKFKKRFRGKRIQQDMKKRIVQKIIMLAQERWNAASCKRLEGLPKEKGIPLYECKLTGGARIIWEKTNAFSPDKKAYIDTIRVWDVVMDHGDLDREIRNVVKSARIVKSMGDNPNTEETADDKRVQLQPESSSEKNEYDLKFYSFTFPVIEALLNGEGKADINFPFKVTELENDIINRKTKPPCPIILLGRSGTGKTTCCLYRLWTEFQNYWEEAITRGPQFPSCSQSSGSCSAREGAPENCQGASSVSLGDSSVKFEHFHPLFITKNDVLCSEVRKNFKGMINTNANTKLKVVIEDSPPNRIQDLEETSWPLIVGSRDWLLLLDASLPEDSFFQRKPDGSLLNKVKGWGKESQHMRFLPVDDENQKMREVQEVHDKTEESDPQRPRKLRPTKSKTLKRELTYQVFRDDLWPKMETKLKKKVHPTLVWTEIRSFIKGSVEALNAPRGFLSRDEYQEIGRKRAPYFLGDRDIIYDLFELYQKFLTSKGMFDEAELVYHLHKRLSENPELPWSIHSVYVDETQDFTQAELSLLIRCCRYRNRMFFTGDTAQSIMKGIAFRFDDIKTLLHDLKAYDNTINVPKSLLQLTHNYRSHSGILMLASSVVRLLERFFPQSFDKLQEDTALFSGPKPVLLESHSWSDLATILRGNERQTSRIEFGAHQAVLVVSEEARDNMPEELKHGLVLTIYEAKGLEFDDVLIYNFFKDSQAKEEWRVVTSYTLKEQKQRVQSAGLVEIHEKDLTPTLRPLEFDYERHKVLNSEFKLLYTAITRARKNIWFFDEDVKTRGPMFEYFKKLNLKTKEETDEALLTSTCAFAERSTKAEWRDKGIFFLNQKKWTLAERCFTNAGDELMTKKSKALRMAEEATAKQDNDMLCAAAVKLLKCDMLNEAAYCLNEAGETLLLEKLQKKMRKQIRVASQSSNYSSK